MPTIICAAMSYGLCSVTPFRAYAKYVGLVGGIIGLLGNRLHVTGICLAKVLLIPNSPFREKLIEASYLRADRPYRYHFWIITQLLNDSFDLLLKQSHLSLFIEKD